MFSQLQHATRRAIRRALTVAGVPVLGLGLMALSTGGANAAVITIDPDAASSGQIINTFFTPQGVTLSADGADGNVYAVDALPPGGGKTFGWMNGAYLDEHWARPSSPNLLAELNFLAGSVSIAYETDSTATLYAYDDTNNLLGSAVSGGFDPAGTLTFTAATDSIRRIKVDLAPMAGADFGMLDNLVFTTESATAIPEANTMAMLAIGGLPFVNLLRRRKA